MAIAAMAVLFFAGAWGYLRLLKLPVPPGSAAALPAGGGSLLSDNSLLLALAALVATAVLMGALVVVPWFSPLAAGLPGVLLLAWTGLYLASVRQAVRLIPLRSDAFGAGWEALLFNGILAAVGAVLVFPLFVPSRWRGRRRQPAADPFTREADQFLAGPQNTGGAMPPRAGRPDRAPALVGTVLPRPSGGFPQAPAATGPLTTVDTSRVTGASRALRTTGPLRADSPWLSAARQYVDRPGYDQGYGDDGDGGLYGHG